jgi:hypothetical protein
LKKLPFQFQRPGPKQQLSLPEAAQAQALPGGTKGQTLDQAFNGDTLAKPGDAKALQEMESDPDIMAARGQLKEAESELEAKMSHAEAANKTINTATLELKVEVLNAEAEDLKKETEDKKDNLKELREKKEKAAKLAESLFDITVNVAKAAFGDEKSGEKAAEGTAKLAIGAAAEAFATALYGTEIDKKASDLKTSTIDLQTVIKKENQTRIATAQSKIEVAKAEFVAANADIVKAVNNRRNALTNLGTKMAAKGSGATDPQERKRIAGLIEALPTIELVASRATQLRLVCLKAQDVPYTMASGIGFGILSAQGMLSGARSPVPDRFIRNASILVGISQEAIESEKSWSERAQSIQSMIDQIGQGPGIPGAPGGTP